MSLSKFLDWVTWHGKMHPRCGQHHSLGCRPGRLGEGTFMSFHLLTVDGLRPAAWHSCSRGFPTIMMTVPSKWAQINCPLSHFCPMFCHSNEKSNHYNHKCLQMLMRSLGAIPSATCLLAHWAIVPVVVVLTPLYLSIIFIQLLDLFSNGKLGKERWHQRDWLKNRMSYWIVPPKWLRWLQT